MNRSTKAFLAYLFPIVTGIVFLIIEKEDEFVRKCAAQAVVFGIAMAILSMGASMMPFLSGILSFALKIIFFVFWILLMVKAKNNVYYRLPIISDLSEKYILNLGK